MTDEPKNCCRHVAGPDGSILTLASLPPPDARWTARRKAELVAAIGGGLLTREDACSRYGISLEEFTEWKRKYRKLGLRGLRAQLRHADDRIAWPVAAAAPPL